MRKGLLILAMLLGVALLPLVAAAPAQAGWGHHHGGWGHHGWRHGGWGHHGWRHAGWGWGHHRHWGWGGGWGGYGHRNWGFGRSFVYRPFFPAAINYYPNVNYGFYPSYGYPVYNSFYGCEYTPATTIVEPYYNTQVVPGATIVNYSGNQGGLSTEVTSGMLIARIADAVRQQPGSTANRTQLTIGNGRLRGVVQNIAQGVIRNESIANVRISNPDSRGKARAYMTQGDNLFLAQRYGAAAEQYRAAASMAPDLAEASWRYGHTLVAMGEYDLAANAIRKAIAVNPNIDRSGFHIDSLYGLIGTAKDSHLESLAKAALEQESPNAYYLLGVTLHYSGEGARATKFFAHAAELQGRNAPHLVAFLGPAPAAPRSGEPEVPPLLARLPRHDL
ncbi:tetratricopeptide repeat protein [Anatilimnocola sp. NA78]|uniref:tetratricopeptide repeat protein n=1 Tax=Anatilimnocola sp. NA78 TaxID=3415683 RepID=UPI003CE577AD